MALLGDLLKKNVLTGLAIGVGAVLLAPTLARVAKPAAKAAIKGGLIAYGQARERIAEWGETAEDLYAEATAELAQEAEQAAKAAADGENLTQGRSDGSD